MQRLEEEFIEFMTDIFSDFGLDRLSARMVGILFIEPGELSMDQLSKRTGYCLASILNKMKILEGIGVVERRKRPGTKKIFFYMDKDIFRIIQRKFDMAYRKEVLPVKERLPQLIERYDEKNMSRKEVEKFRIIKRYYRQMLQLEQMFDKIHSTIDELKKANMKSYASVP
jgi:DNA-binding transcriptional regulator GbsR (MarR family)